MADWKSLCSEASSVTKKEDALELYQTLQEEEDRLGKELDHLLEQQTQIDVQMTNFKRIIPSLQSLQVDSQGLNRAIVKTCTLAENISGKVRILDTAKMNVYSALKRVDDVIDLKNCVSGVEQAMSSDNYEKAALHVRRYLDLDETVLMESTAESANTGTSSVSNSFSKLKEAELKLKKIVQEKLSYAVVQSNKEGVARFVKIMPLLNLHQEGVEQLVEYLSSEINNLSQDKLTEATDSAGDQSGLIYARVLMTTLEEVARKYEQYLSMIESTYGAEWIVAFVKMMQNTCDHQVVIILKQHSEERVLENKVHTVAIALNSRSTAGAIRPDPKELDTLLTEMSLISSRTELYFKFLRKKAQLFNIESEISTVIKGSEASRSVQELIGYYILIENFFMRESLSKAISVEEVGPSDLVSSLCDDAFFVIQKSLKRAFSTQNTDGSCAMLNNARTLLLEDYKEQLQRNLTSHVTTAQSGGGGIDLSDFPSMFQTQSSKSNISGPSAWREIGIACNNIETSCQNLTKLISLLQNEIRVLLNESGDVGKNKLESCLSELRATSNILGELKKGSQSHLVQCFIVPELEPLLKLFSSSSHIIEEDVMMDDEFMQSIAAFLSQKLNEAKAHLLPDLYEGFVLELVAGLGRALEVEIMSSQFNQLGGVHLDRDLRQLISFLSNQTKHPVRDKFAKIMQMATILSLEKVSEIQEYCGTSSGTLLLHLNTREVKAVLHLRNDFRGEEIDRLTI